MFSALTGCTTVKVRVGRAVIGSGPLGGSAARTMAKLPKAPITPMVSVPLSSQIQRPRVVCG